MTLTFDLMTFNVLMHRLSRDQTMYQVLEKPKKSAAEFTGNILHARLSSEPLGNLKPFPRLPGRI